MAGGKTTGQRSEPAVEDYRSAEPQLRLARIGIGIAVVFAVLDGFVSLFAAAVTGWAIGMGSAGSAAPVDNMMVSAAAAELIGWVMIIATAAWLLFAVALLSSGINVIRWQLVTLTNVAALGPDRRWPAPWAVIAAWIVPVWSLFGPKQSLDDLWRSSDPMAPDDTDRTALSAIRVPGTHALWWGLWVGAMVLNAISTVRMTRTPTLGSMLNEQLTLVVVDFALVGAGLLLQRILTLTTARQDARYAERAAVLAHH